MRVPASFVAAVAGLLVLTGGASATAAPPPSAVVVVTATGPYSVPYAPYLYEFLDFAPLPPLISTSVYKIDYSSWAAGGFESPRQAPTRYVKAPWSPTIFAVHEFVGRYQTGLVVHPLTFGQWQTANFPTPVVTTRIPSAAYTGYSASPEIDVTIQGETHALTLSEWLASGSPAPRIVGWKPGAELVRYVTSYPEIFAVAPDASAHRVTYAEWLAWGSPAFRSTQAEGYYALSWAPEGIAFVGEDLLSGQVAYAAWAAADFPSPRLVSTIDQDKACLDYGAGTVTYDGATWSGTMTIDEAGQRFSLWGIPSC